MTSLEAVLLLTVGVGLALVLGEFRWFRRRTLTARLRPYSPFAARPGEQVDLGPAPRDGGDGGRGRGKVGEEAHGPTVARACDTL